MKSLKEIHCTMFHDNYIIGRGSVESK